MKSTPLRRTDASGTRRLLIRLVPLLVFACPGALLAQDRSTTPGGLVSIPYRFNTGPLKQITYKLKIAKAPEKRAYYYAMQFTIEGDRGSRSGYTGIQPREPGTARATFSVWGDVSSTSAGCKTGADNESGISCMAEIPFEFNNYYYLIVRQDGSDPDLWRGTVVNRTSGKESVIGEIHVKNGAKGLKASHSGFVEYFASIDDCASLPATTVIFDPPVDSNGSPATLTTPALYGKCKSHTQMLVSQRVSDGYQISLNGK